MSRSNWRFLGYCVLLYSAFALPWAFPQAAFSQEATAEIETSRKVIEGELRVEILEQQLHKYMESSGDRGTEEFQHLFRDLIEARKWLAEVRKRLVAEHLEETKSRTLQEVQTVKAKLQEQQAQMQEQVAKFHEEKEKFTRALQEAHRELEQRREASMPSLEKTETRVFHLRHIDGHRLRQTLKEILGPQLIRLSADASPHTLVVRAGKETLSTVESLISNLDNPKVVSKSENHSELPRSLMVRIFWLSDGRTYPEAQPALEFLPDSVFKALQRVGIGSPYIVLQSNTSIALEEDMDDAARFEVHDLPAIVFRERLRFNAWGYVRAVGGDRISLRMEVGTYRPVGKEHLDESHVSGSMIAPLKHFVILGTANYASKRPDIPYVEGEGEATSPEVPGDGTHSSSRFAFVVQTIESQSFAPEE